MENPTIEQEIAAIEQKLAEKKAELNKQEVHSAVMEQMQEISVPVPTLPSVENDSINPNRDESGQKADTSNVGFGTTNFSGDLKDKVQELVNLAFTKSIEEAVKAASKLNNPALIDAFHDVLVDQLYNTLIERGKLKKM